jgi:hypothetical protein
VNRALAPRKPTKFEEKMAELIQSLSSKFDLFSTEFSDLNNKVVDGEPVMRKILDNLAAMESRQAKADESVAAILNIANDAAVRLQRLEQLPPLPQQPQQQPPSGWINPFDLSSAPSEAARPSASASERPNGHRPQHDHQDVGGGILGSHPPLPVTCMSQPPTPRAFDLHQSSQSSSSSHSHTPKINFPTFDGTNPRLWKDKYESYFEIFGVSDALKPRFAALNFTGPAEAWLQTLELRGRTQSWGVLVIGSIGINTNFT